MCYQPWSTSTTIGDYYAYGSSFYNLNDQTGQADWGYNAISNGGNTTNTWRTLTRDEWVYIFYTRITSSGIRYVRAKVNDVNGIIILPDNWSSALYSLNNANVSNSAFANNAISLVNWMTVLEPNGAIFLPSAGYRNGFSFISEGSLGDYYGGYWSATSTYCMHFDSHGLAADGYFALARGNSVRLVRDVIN